MSYRLNSNTNLYSKYNSYSFAYNSNNYRYTPSINFTSKYPKFNTHSYSSGLSRYPYPLYNPTLHHHDYLTREIRINDPEVESRMDEETRELKHKLGVSDWNNLVKDTKKEIYPLKVDYPTNSKLNTYSNAMKIDYPKSPKLSQSHHKLHHHRSLSCNPTTTKYNEKKSDENVLEYMDKEIVKLKDELSPEYWNSIYDDAEREMNKSKYINDSEIENYLDKSVKEMKYEMSVEEWNDLIKETRRDIKYREHMKDYGINNSNNKRNTNNNNNSNNKIDDKKEMDKKEEEDNDGDDDCELLVKPSNPIRRPNALINERLKMSRMRSNSVEVNRNKYVDKNTKNSLIGEKTDDAKSKINPNKSKIIQFYLNKYKSEPENVYIEDIIQKWKGDYFKLEIKHGYIQWIFPLYERGLNFLCPAITADEVEYLKNDKECMSRMDKLLDMMLDFYGMKLIKDKSINKRIVVRTDQYKVRYNNMVVYQHNFLRISRILNSLNIMCKKEESNAFLNHLIYEIYVSDKLNKAKYSCENYWLKFSNNFKIENINKMTKEKIIKTINDTYHI